MNIHIELVKKWIADSESVSQKELRVNRIAAAASAASAASAATAAFAASAAAAAAFAASAAAYDDAAYWVERCEALKEQGNG